MNTRCDICGCVTDPLDLEKFAISNKERDVCSFCRKRIKEVESDPLNQADAARNLLYMDTKGHRTEETNILIRKHFFELGIDINAVSGPTPVPVPVPVNNTVPAPAIPNQNAEFEEMKKEFEKLKESFKSFKRRYYLSKILGVVAPVIVLIIGLIVLYKLGTIQTFIDYFNYLSEYASA